MNAKKHLKLFKEGAKIVEQMGIDGLNAYLTSEYFGENPVRDRLNAPNAKFWKVDEQEDLIALNATWLRQHPKLIVLTIDRMYEEVHRRGRALPDREKRIAAARANEPRYIKIIRALCEVSGQELDRVTAGDPSYVHEGVQTLAWHFITDKGHHYMVALGETAMMFHGDTRDRICETGIQNIPD